MGCGLAELVAFVFFPEVEAVARGAGALRGYGALLPLWHARGRHLFQNSRTFVVF